MPGRLAIDFGTSNTVLAVWDDVRQAGVALPVPEYSTWVQQGDGQVPLIPSLIHYAGQARWVGGQVVERGLYGSNQTFRWMKRYILNRSPVRKLVDGRPLSNSQAGADFLSAVLQAAAAELDLGDEEIALPAPVEAFEHYENWLAETASQGRLPRFRLIDEPSAAALGYGAHIQPGDLYLIFDFGGGTLNVSIILIEEEGRSAPGRRGRVLGKAGEELGGAVIDQWLFQEALERSGLTDADPQVRPVSSALLVACEHAKQQLSFAGQAEIRVADLQGKPLVDTLVTQSQLEELLDRREAFTTLDRAIRRAGQAAFERGYRLDDIKAVLLVGGSSQIPSVQRTLTRIFGRDRVMLDRPLDAVARGAAAFAAGADFYDHIQHDYAIRFLNRAQGAYDYRVIVPRGAPYPTRQPLERMLVKATQEGQTRLGIAIIEIGSVPGARPASPATSHWPDSQRLELVFDPGGAARLVDVTPEEQEQRTHFWMNESTPTFLTANPPASAGEARFEVTFSVDANKRLLISAKDLRTGVWVYENFPVVKLV